LNVLRFPSIFAFHPQAKNENKNRRESPHAGTAKISQSRLIWGRY
jgi:hypothetical protein